MRASACGLRAGLRQRGTEALFTYPPLKRWALIYRPYRACGRKIPTRASAACVAHPAISKRPTRRRRQLPVAGCQSPVKTRIGRGFTRIDTDRNWAKTDFTTENTGSTEKIWAKATSDGADEQGSFLGFCLVRFGLRPARKPYLRQRGTEALFTYPSLKRWALIYRPYWACGRKIPTQASAAWVAHPASSTKNGRARGSMRNEAPGNKQKTHPAKIRPDGPPGQSPVASRQSKQEWAAGIYRQ